jgi:uroporphyrinogen III methyltransferase/synthase
MSPAKVFLVGAGPGDPGLITVKGADALRQADVVVYDRLCNAALLDYAPAHAERVFMGKEPDTPGAFQHAINQALVKEARAGKTVVRLKGGDPFVFGRGSEELLALHAAGVDCEVVPGISSATAVPAYAGIPVTHRGTATAFTVVSGSEDPTKPESSLDWPALAKTPGTVVVLMGWRSLPDIVRTLVKNGRASSTPVAITQWGTLPNQRTVTGTLNDIIQRSLDAGLESPVVAVIGEVAALRGQLRWFDTRPLFGKRILVTRSRTHAGMLSKALRAQGAEAVELPTIEIQPLDDYAHMDSVLAGLGRYDWIVFPSAAGVEAVFNRLQDAGKDSRAIGPVKVAAIGPATAQALLVRGIVADFVPSTFSSQGIAKEFQHAGVFGANVLLPRSDIGEEALPEGLTALGALVDEVTAYRTVLPSGAAQRAKELLAAGAIDVVTFTSSSTVRNLVALLDRDITVLSTKLVASIGPATSRMARELGLEVHIEAEEHTVPGLVQSLIAHDSANTVEV